jgi:hypothetical protein
MSLGVPAGSAAAGLLLQLMPPATAVLGLAAALAVGTAVCAGQRALWRGPLAPVTAGARTATLGPWRNNG